ncbi:hypothetical protein K492DRAFT_206319 [Lichtheimia hyalospora FSU 10163]|nr:hypothetical protein K492DRAFT_206319 [Lichtheimia hyalospora FSU 10163]
MGKKKAPVFRDASAKKKNEDEGASIKAIRTWDDIEHDSEDEFHDRRGKVLLEDDADNDDEESDAEVYGLGSDEEEEEELSDDDIVPANKDDSEEEEDQTWGKSKQAYYDADEGDDLDEMREEETEALKIQKEQLAAMDEADFMDEWGTGPGADEEADKQLVEDVTKDLDDITFDIKQNIAKRRKNIPIAEKLRILQNESPELLDLLNEFKDKSETMELLDTLLARIQSKGKSDEHEAKFLRFKHQLLMNYLTNVSFYLVLKASGTTGLKDHPVIDALVELRSQLEKTDQLEVKLQPEINAFMDRLDTPEKPATKKEASSTKKSIKKASSSKKEKQQPVPTSPELDEADYMVTDDEEEEDDDAIKAFDIEQEFKSLKKSSKAAKKRKRGMQDDFGELEALDEMDMEDKLAKKRSLRDYVAKIDARSDQKLTRYQGDVDLPYKGQDNWKQKNGVAQPKDSTADLDDEDYDENDLAAARNMRGDEDDDQYYSQAVAEKAAQKAAKRAQYEASRPEIIDGDWQVEEGEKRLASYKILKNKGLTPKRKKENRNARVKNRTKYSNKLKKLASVRAVAKPLQGSYGGESTGIKKNVVKSVRF